jgi:hypothetical protein
LLLDVGREGCRVAVLKRRVHHAVVGYLYSNGFVSKKANK